VLDNDRDAEGSRLTASLVKRAAHGVVLLFGDGSFVYLPKPGFVGADTFVYRASDGVLASTAVVTVEVRRNKDDGRRGDGDDDDEGAHDRR
jgi:hypothetical protein